MIKITEAEAKKYGIGQEQMELVDIEDKTEKAEESKMRNWREYKEDRKAARVVKQAGKTIIRTALNAVAIIFVGMVFIFILASIEDQRLAKIESDERIAMKELEYSIMLDEHATEEIQAAYAAQGGIDYEAVRTTHPEYQVLKATYYDYLYIECDNGESYEMDIDGNWYEDGKVIYEDGEKVTVVVSADTVLAVIR